VTLVISTFNGVGWNSFAVIKDPIERLRGAATVVPISPRLSVMEPILEGPDSSFFLKSYASINRLKLKRFLMSYLFLALLVVLIGKISSTCTKL
jgi:hypothetical protein